MQCVMRIEPPSGAAVWCRRLLMPCSMVSQFSRSVRKFRCHNFADFDLVSKISDARSSRHYLHDIQRPQNAGQLAVIPVRTKNSLNNQEAAFLILLQSVPDDKHT